MSDGDKKGGAAKSISSELSGGRIGPIRTGKLDDRVKLGEHRFDEDD